MEKKTTSSRDGRELLEIAKQCCIAPVLNSEDAGPGIYLVKQIYRQYGKAFLTTLTTDRAMEWIIPSHLRKSDKVTFITDSISMYSTGNTVMFLGRATSCRSFCIL